MTASRWASVKPSSVKRFAADLYSPRATNWASMPALCRASRRNVALVAKPTSPTLPEGCIQTSPNAEAR
ncbi:Uncharacterised protein [Mycobacterium tuberculosis]|nr:Uncharacterised protein [Mycobacterium tuberculosis]